MRIIFVCSYYKPAYVYGGPTRSISSLAEAMVKAGAHITVLTTNANGPGCTLDFPLGQPINVDGVEVFYYPLSTPLSNVIRYFSRALGQACQSSITQFDAAYVPGEWTYSVYVGANAAIKNQIPYIMSPRGSIMDWAMQERGLKKRLYLELVERKLINRAAAIHATSSLEEVQLQKWHLKSPVVRIPNGINLDGFATPPVRGKLRRLYGIPQGGTLSLFVGRLHKMKRLDLIVSSFALVAKSKPDAHLLLVGPDQDGSGNAAQEQARQLGISDKVHFAGILTGSELVQAYADADMLILTSHRENFGNVVVEAMTVGLPVLLSHEVGLAEEVKQANAGIIVRADAAEISQAWLRLVSDQDLRECLGNNGKRLVYHDFTADTVARKMLSLFESIL